MRIFPILTSVPLALAMLAPVQAQEVLTGADAYGKWSDDAPGIRRHITPDALAEPINEGDPEAPDYQNLPELVDPEDRLPEVVEGFSVELFAEGLTQPRVIRIAPNGDIFVADSDAGQVVVFAADSEPGATPEVFTEGLDRPFGILFHPPADPQHVYVASADQVTRYAYDGGRMAGEGEVIISDIPTERHWTRDLASSPDGQQIFISIGSASNVAATMADMTPEEITAHEESHGLGAPWGDEENRAVVRVFDPDGQNIRNYATGLRNCSGMTIQPGSGTLWCTGNERDHLEANLVPDYLTSVQDGAFYGWPWYYIGDNEDPAHAGKRPDLAGQVTVPDVLLQAHSSTMQIVFYDGDAFPEAYHGDAFATMRGSWNREDRTGYKVVRALFEDGQPTGVYEDFMTGFVLDDANVWGRPTGIAVTPEGDLLVSDDANGRIFRVTAD